MKGGLLKRLTAIAAALTAAIVCCCNVFASITVTSSAGSRIEIKNGSIVIERQSLNDRGMWSSFILKDILMNNPPEEEGGKINSGEENTTEAITETVTEGTTESTEEYNGFDDYVYEVVRLTNEERAKYGLPELKISEKLTEAAQEHAEDMYLNNIFSHTYSNGDTIADRVEGYNCLGENIAFGCTSAEGAVSGWMNSEGHRANILYEGFTEIGVGFKEGYWVQMFGG
ncbi:MAG: CAP domain-containing protein [Clostridiales bacterium]|nr:CAP domain-containing protein [Clostridiales bacterium]